MLLIATLIAILAYAGASWLQWQRLSAPQLEGRNLIRGLGALAFVMHGYNVYRVLHYPEGIDLGLFPVGSLIRITSYNVCYTKLLRAIGPGPTPARR